MQTKVTCNKLTTWVMTYEQAVVLAPEIRRDAAYERHYSAGRADKLAGKPCLSSNGAYLDGWYEGRR